MSRAAAKSVDRLLTYAAVLAAALLVLFVALCLIPQRLLPVQLSPAHWVGYDEPRLPTASMMIGKQKFLIEIAATEAARRHGLMDRDSMPANQAMIFVFSVAQPLFFYMKDTRIPLDIIYLDADANVISIHHMKPFVESPTTDSERPAKWAIELNDGAAAAAGVEPGQHLTVPPEAQYSSE